MAAAEMTETVVNMVPNFNAKLINFSFVGVTTGDWVIFDEPIGAVTANLITGGTAATVYAVGAVHTNGIAATGTTTMVYDGVTAEQMPAEGYIMVADEILHYSGVTKSGTSGTATIDERGCFGTTAAAASDADVFYILNTVVFTLGTIGTCRGIAAVLEE